jgi:hypothetical protein
VRGLNLQSTGDDLKELFCRYGTVRDVYIPVDYHTREPRGFCYVEYPFTAEVGSCKRQDVKKECLFELK